MDGQRKNYIRWISPVMFLLFLSFAGLQWNDPDPGRWMATYGLVAAMWCWRWWAQPPRWITIPVFLGLSVWWVTLIPSVIHWINMGAPSLTGSMKAESPHIELVREWGGLMITLVAVLPLLPGNRKLYRRDIGQKSEN